MIGVIMYGPPAAGKDTITGALHKIAPEYSLFQRVKVGVGRTDGYRMATEPEIASLRECGEIVWENSRYGSSYYVDRNGLAESLRNSIPVVHLGQAPAIEAVRSAIAGARWLVVSVWCPREVAEKRIIARDTGDTTARLSAWDATEPVDADVAIDTSELAPAEAARLIDQSRRALNTR
jgi:guanylate kinase